MPSDNSIIDALKAALDKDPDNSSIRLHLGSLYQERGDHQPALDEAQRVLGSEPANIDALKLAADAAEKLGDLAKASGYRSLVNALSDAPVPRSSFSRDGWDDVIEETF